MSTPEGPSDWEVLRTGSLALAEGPAWDRESNSLLWVDIPTGCVIRSALDGPPEADVVMTSGTSVGFALPTADGGVVVGAGRRVLALDHDLAGGRVVHEVEAPDPIRINDAAVDPNGRLVFGTMDPLKSSPGRALVRRLEPDGSSTDLADGFTIANGIGWSPDGRTVYLTDSTPHRIYAAAYGEDRLRLEVFAIDADGQPDGLAVDADGFVWSASYGGGAVKRYSPSGDHVETIEVPFVRPAGVAFAGPALQTLVVSIAQADAGEVRPVLLGRRADVPGLASQPVALR